MFRVFTTSKVTGQRVEILEDKLTERQAERFCEEWGWNYDDGERSFWLDYEEYTA